MKKLMILAVAAIALVACSKTFDTHHHGNEGKAIGFGTWTETLTKARATGATATTSFVDDESFKVYGTKTKGGTQYVVFNGDVVTADVASTVSWSYVTTRYWDPSATSYTFYAALPGSMVTAYASLTEDQKTAISSQDYPLNGKFYGSFTFSDPTNITNDVMIAEREDVLNDAFGNIVELDFNHIASCVSLYAKKDAALSDATVTVTGVKFKNIKKTGDFHVSSYSPVTVAWSGQTSILETEASSGIYNVALGGDKAVTAHNDYTDHAAGAVTGTAVALLEGYVFLPQSFTAATEQILLSYTIQIGTEEANVYTDVPIDLIAFKTTDTDDNSGSAIGSWDAKTHYQYTITIGANAIEFSAKVIAWANTIDGYHYLVN